MSFNDDHALETYKSLITISVEVVKALLYLNGGAIVALLAYVGQAQNGSDVAKHATWTLIWFVIGLVLSVVAFIGSGFTRAIDVSGNWRLTFAFESGDALEIDYEDYH